MALQLTETQRRARSESTPPAGVEEILLLHHSHLDVGYTHSQPVVWELQQEFITQAIVWLEQTHHLPEGSRPKWTCEATEPLRRWLKRASPEQVERFRTLHRQGRIGVAALRWHIGACVDRAGLRRLLDGKQELEHLLGTSIRVACQHDVNGVPWPLADVLLEAGVDFFVMGVNPHLGRAVPPRPGMFMWEAPSGRSLRVFNGNAYTMFDQLLLAWDDSVERMAEAWSVAAQRLSDMRYPFPFLYLTSTCSPVMWDNAPPNPFLPALVQRWNDSGHRPRVRYATLEDLRERALAVPEDELDSLRGDWTDYWAFGCGSAPIATALNQRAKPLLAAASVLAGGEKHPALRQGSEFVDLYDEHTFGYWDTVDEHPQTQTVEVLKQALAHEGYELASFALMHALERLAGNPPADKGVKGVLLCNPGPRPLTVRPELPNAWFAEPEPSTERTYRASRMVYDGRSWESGFPGEAPRAFGPIELAPFSWQVIPLEELADASATSDLSHQIESAAVEHRTMNMGVVAEHEQRVGTIESSFYRLRYDVDSGRILSGLVARARKRNEGPPLRRAGNRRKDHIRASARSAGHAASRPAHLLSCRGPLDPPRGRARARTRLCASGRLFRVSIGDGRRLDGSVRHRRAGSPARRRPAPGRVSELGRGGDHGGDRRRIGSGRAALPGRAARPARRLPLRASARHRSQAGEPTALGMAGQQLLGDELPEGSARPDSSPLRHRLARDARLRKPTGARRQNASAGTHLAGDDQWTLGPRRRASVRLTAAPGISRPTRHPRQPAAAARAAEARGCRNR